MLYVLYTLHVMTCLFLILVVLLQRGKGADLSVFGGGSTQAAFGARSAATLLHKLTVGFFVAFILTTMTIAFLQSSTRSSSVVSGIETEAPATPAADAAAPATSTPPAAEAGDAEAGDGSSDGSGDQPTPEAP